jgi:hypothetical protein
MDLHRGEEWLARRAHEMCESPAGVAFLLTAKENSLSVTDLANPTMALHVAAVALSVVNVFRNGHERVVNEARRRGSGLLKEALVMMREPAAQSWFSPLRRNDQVRIIRSEIHTDSTTDQLPGSPNDWWEGYAQKSGSAIYTSSQLNGTSSIFAAMVEGAGDFIPELPIEWSRLHVPISARVFEVASAQDWYSLAARYPASDDAGRLVPHWGLVAEEWDGVHLSLGGLLTAEQVRIDGTRGWSEHRMWDAEQTSWFRWCFDGVEELSALAALPTAPIRLRRPASLRH